MAQTEALGETIDYDVVRSEDATQPRIDVDIHQIKVVLPADSDADPDELVRENAQWIIEKKREYEEYREQAPDRSFERGEEFPFLGDQRTVVVEDVDEHTVRDEELVLPESRVGSSSIRAELERLYRREARQHFEERVDHYADEMNVEYESIAVRNQRTRWGSCSAKENLSFNWRLMMAPPDVVDYVVVHELAHLKEKNHTRRFWEIVKDHLPDYKEHAEWLEDHSAALVFTEDDL